jgi:naphthoate synthase
MGDNPFHASAWRPVDGFANLTDITYHRHVSDATVRVAFNRPEVRNAFRRPHGSQCPRIRPSRAWSPLGEWS